MDYLVNLAKTDPKTFVPLLAKIIPAESRHEGGVGVSIKINLGD